MSSHKSRKPRAAVQHDTSTATNMITAMASNNITSNQNIAKKSNQTLICTMASKTSTHQDVGDALTLNSPSVRFIPCRARGVCDTHTPQSAYFTLPQDCKHGTSLLCSHSLCRESGRGFRYCKVCDQVTAKRNFNKRHCHHPDVGGSTCSTELSTSDSFSRSSKKRKRFVDADGDSSSASSIADVKRIPQEIMRSDENASSNSGDVPSTVYTTVKAGSSSMHMELSWGEARLIQHIRMRGGSQEETLRWIHEILECDSNIGNMLTEDIHTDDESDWE